MRGWLLAVLLVSAGSVGCIGSAGDDAATQTQTQTQNQNQTPTSTDPIQTQEVDTADGDANVVLAVIDTGINLYHEEYRAGDRWPEASPSQPPIAIGTEAEPVELSFDREGWAAAVEADEEVLGELEPEQLYTFPGTKILGAISFTGDGGDWPVILDRPGGHGTMTSSRAVGDSVSIPGEDPGVWVVMVQGYTPKVVEWTTEQGWIDMVSISSGMSTGGLVPAAANIMAEDAIEAFHEASHAKPLFASSGNGVANARVVGFPSWLRGASGVPDAVSVGATDNGNLVQWDNQDAYIAADGCANPAARADAVNETGNHGGGTSSATPFSAGGAAKMLLEARRALNDTDIGPRVDEDRSVPEDAWDSGYAGDARIVLAEGEADGIEAGPLADGVLTMREFKDVLYHSALLTPTEDDSDGEECAAGAGVPVSAVPEDARFPFQGYGEVNDESIETAIAVLEGEAELPERAMDDWHYERAHSHKQTFVAGEPTPPPPPRLAGPQR